MVVVKLRTDWPCTCMVWLVEQVRCAQEMMVDCTHSRPYALESLKSGLLVSFCWVGAWIFQRKVLKNLLCIFCGFMAWINPNRNILKPCQVTKHMAEVQGSYLLKSKALFHHWSMLFGEDVYMCKSWTGKCVFRADEICDSLDMECFNCLAYSVVFH